MRPALCDPVDGSSPGSSVLGDSPGKHNAEGCHALLQEIFLTQGSAELVKQNSGRALVPLFPGVIYQLT